MTKREFLAVLQRELYNLPQDELKEQMSFYSEMIDDGMEEGLSEEQAVSKIGSISEILSGISHDKPEPRSMPKEKRSGGLGAWAIVLIILGSPIWLSLLVAAVAVLISAYAVIWSLWVALAAVEISFAACAVAGVVLSLVYIPLGKVATGLFMLGAGVMLLGLSIFLWFACKAVLVGVVKLSKMIFVGFSSILKRKVA